MTVLLCGGVKPEGAMDRDAGQSVASALGLNGDDWCNSGVFKSPM